MVRCGCAGAFEEYNTDPDIVNTRSLKRDVLCYLHTN